MLFILKALVLKERELFKNSLYKCYTKSSTLNCSVAYPKGFSSRTVANPGWPLREISLKGQSGKGDDGAGLVERG